jgi:hypothetical protein
MAATRRIFLRNDVCRCFGGAVAQLGERLVRNEEVRGSNPLGSTKPKAHVSLSFPWAGAAPQTPETSVCHNADTAGTDMATIRRRKSKWQAQVRRQGHPPLSRTFHLRADAELWARQTEAELDRGGLPVDKVIDQLSKYDAEIFTTGHLGQLLGKPWRELSSNVLRQPNFMDALETLGWRYVPGKGRGGSRFERVRPRHEPSCLSNTTTGLVQAL